jgi:hypothetical protein
MQKYKQFENVNAMLYYLKQNKLIDVKFKNFEVLAILQRRNKLAKYLKRLETSKEFPVLPPMINSPYDCNKCYNSVGCAFLHILSDKPKILYPKKKLYSQRSVVDIEDFNVSPDFKLYYEMESTIFEL